MGVVSELALGFCCRTLLLGSDAHLEPPVWTELSHLMNNILGEERVVENVRSCESLVWVHHQHPRDLQKQTRRVWFIHSCQIFMWIDVSKVADQIFNGVWTVLPFRRWHVVSSGQDHPQHQYLFPVPERRRARKQRVHDDPWTPSAEGWSQFLKKKKITFTYHSAWFQSLYTHMSTAVPYPLCPASMEHSIISGAR